MAILGKAEGQEMTQQRQQIIVDGFWAILLRFCLIALPVVGTVFTAVALPWIKWVTETCYRQERYDDRIVILEADARTNIQDHSRILVSLEQIKAKLGVGDQDPK
jgi:hypothetical protein